VRRERDPLECVSASAVLKIRTTMTAMGHPSTLTNQQHQPHHEVHLTKHQGVLPRAQSSLELLSQTAIEIESANSSPRSLILSRASSPAATRVTPNVVSETLVLPELVHKATMMGLPLHNEDENTSNNKGNIKGLLHKNHHQAPTLMPRPAADYGAGSLASLIREPSGLYVTLLGGNSHPTTGGGIPNHQSFPDHHGLYHSSSFSSSCGGSFHQPTTTATTTTTAPEPSSSVSAITVSTSSSSANPNGHPDHSTSHHQSTENSWLRRELAAKDSTIATLQIQVQNLTQEIRQLRQLPTGKISQIPLE
jgi:hypothetical protein